MIIFVCTLYMDTGTFVGSQEMWAMDSIMHTTHSFFKNVEPNVHSHARCILYFVLSCGHF